MEAPTSPGTQHVVDVVNRGEDTDGEVSDVDVDYPAESFVSQHDGDENENGRQDKAAELELTGEGTAGGPFGLKRVLFVKKRSERSVGSGEDDQKETFKDRFSKLGAGMGERFAALGSIMQDHSKNVGGSQDVGKTAAVSDTAVNLSKVEAVSNQSAVRRQQSGASNSCESDEVDEVQAPEPREALEYFQEYEMTFACPPGFAVVAGPANRGGVVSWGDGGEHDTETGTSSITVRPDNVRPASNASRSSLRVPPSGTSIIAIAGEPVEKASTTDIQARLTRGYETAPPSTDEGEMPDDSASADVGVGGSSFPLVVRFREKTGPVRNGNSGPAGSDFFRSKVKAMATGIGALFQAKDGSGSVVRDASGISADPAANSHGAGTEKSDSFVLTFAAEGGRLDDLPFTLAEMINGRGVVVSTVSDGYSSSLVLPAESGVSSAGTAAAPEKLSRADESGVLTPGAIVMRIAGQSVENHNLSQAKAILEKAAEEHSMVKILFKRAPPIYRASVAMEEALVRTKVPHIHLGTWQPLLKRRAGITLGGPDGNVGYSSGGVIGIGYGGEEWEDVRETMARTERFVNSFRSCGIRVDIASMYTVTLPRGLKTSAYSGVFDGRPAALQQAVRLTFSFPEERTISVPRGASDRLGLQHVDTGASGPLSDSWVIVTATEGSPCADAGLPVGENSILTHVNGYDVSPAAYRSLAPILIEEEGWAAAVLPALESVDGDTITLTFV